MKYTRKDQVTCLKQLKWWLGMRFAPSLSVRKLSALNMKRLIRLQEDRIGYVTTVVKRDMKLIFVQLQRQIQAKEDTMCLNQRGTKILLYSKKRPQFL